MTSGQPARMGGLRMDWLELGARAWGRIMGGVRSDAARRDAGDDGSARYATGNGIWKIVREPDPCSHPPPLSR